MENQKVESSPSRAPTIRLKYVTKVIGAKFKNTYQRLIAQLSKNRYPQTKSLSEKPTIALPYRSDAFCGGCELRNLKHQAFPLLQAQRYTQISLGCSGSLMEGKKAVLDETTLEQRLVTLEAAVSDLQHKLEEKPASKNWLEKLIGSVSDEAAFREALEYGRTFRQTGKSGDDTTED